MGVWGSGREPEGLKEGGLSANGSELCIQQEEDVVERVVAQAGSLNSCVRDGPAAPVLL